MKKLTVLSIMLLLFATLSKSQTTNDILNLLIEKKTITQAQADSLRAQDAIKQQEAEAKKKSFNVTAGKSVQLSGYLQTRYQINDEPGKIDGFDLRRAYLDLKGTLSAKWGYRLQTDFANGPKIVDLYTDFKVNDYLNFTFGQFAIPFSRENLTSNTKSEFIERSQVVESLVARGKDVISSQSNQNGRDIGVQAGGTLIKTGDKTWVEYKIGLFNGSGINTADKNESKDVVTRILLHPIQGLDLGASYYNGLGNWGTPAKNRKRNRIGFELGYELDNFTFSGEFISGQDASVSKQGYYVQAGYYVLPKKLQFLGKIDSFDPNTQLDSNASTWYIAGLNFIITPNILLQANYTFKEEQGNKITNNLAAIQLQARF
jgi:phosphate-selective porin OprO and OprP